MNPRRLIPYLLIFLVMVGAYVGLKWREAQRAARKERAKKIFHLKETEISALSLIRGPKVVSLAKKQKIWYLTAPLDTKADQTITDSVVGTLVRLRTERDLGVEKDLKPYGLKNPGLVVKFTAQGKPHQLAVGAKVPGGESYYVLKDHDPRLLMISRGSKDTLDRSLLALRDKTLLSFISSEVEGLKIVTGKKTTADLKQAGPGQWRWVGRPHFKVRGDKVDKLLRDLQLAQAKNFVEPPPKNLRPLGLVPRRRTVVTVITSKGNQTLLLGAKKDDTVYARKGDKGPIMLVEASLPDEITKTLASLEDRRLWSGAIPRVHQVIWGPPGKTWIAKKNKESWQITGPDQAATKQPAVRLEMALWDFQKLEALKTLTKAGAAGSPAYLVELRGRDGKPLFHLEEIGSQGKKTVKVVTRTGAKIVAALVRQKPFKEWQDEMKRLTASAKKQQTPEKGKSAKSKP
ncbi:MAG: DUF4340 domain-containing protein [Deltaproteobacteria bacterium]|jgi:hypothetical protein